MAKVTTYENSKFASFLSILGYIAIVGGVYCIFQGEAGIGIVALVLGFVFKVLAGFISQKKREKEAKRNTNS